MRSLRSNLLAFAILATLIPTVGLGLMSFVGYQEVINRSVDQELRALARDASAELALWTRERAHDVRAVATAYTLADGLDPAPARGSAPRVGAADLALYLASVQRRLGAVLELVLYDGTGNPVATSTSEPSRAPAAIAAQGVLQANGSVTSPPRFDEARGTSTLGLSVPVLSLRNEVVGAVFALVDLRAVEPRLADTVSGTPAEVLVLALDGTLLAASPRAVDVRGSMDPDTVTRLRGQAGMPVEFDDGRGRAMLGVAAPPTALPVVVIAQRERAEVFGAWLDHVKAYVALAAGLMALVAAVAYWMGRSIATPLVEMRAAAQRVARGDLSVTLHDSAKDEIGQLSRAFDAMTDRLRASHADVESANEALRASNAELTRLATTDSLTGLANRKVMDEALAARVERFRLERAPFALVMVAIDNLEAINADYGLPEGDDVLVKVAALLRQSVPPPGIVGRYAGERFLAIVDGLPFDAVMDVAEHVRTLVEAPDFGDAKHAIVTTVSLGIAQSRDGDADAASVLFRADHALHEARRSGGNRVQSAM